MSTSRVGAVEPAADTSTRPSEDRSTNGSGPPPERVVEELRRANERIAALERRVEELAGGEPSRGQRRQELKLARQERDRKVEQAEGRLAEHSSRTMAAIEREGAVAEQRVRTARAHAEEALAATAGDAVTQVQQRVSELRDTEVRLTALMDQIAAAAERACEADERTLAAEQRLVSVERAATG